jgi:zinc protease
MRAPELDVTKFEYPSGLVLLVVEQHYAEVASVQAWCQTGSIHEGKWLGAGMTHLLEHMLFKGTQQRTALQLSEEIHQVGGYLNAYTSFDRTVFWADCPKGAVRTALELLADMLFRSVIDPAELQREMDVIRREFDMGLDDPDRMLSQLTFSMAFQVHPCRFPVIGLREIFEQITRDELLDYYRRRYAPNNLFLVVAGDIDSQEVNDTVGQYFGGPKPTPLEAIVLPDEPPQIARRESGKIFDSDLGYFSLAWHIPPLFSEEMPALDVTSMILGGGASSVLYEELRERQGAVYGVTAFSYTPSFPGLLMISGACPAEGVEEIESRVVGAISEWQRSRVTQSQLAKAKRMIWVHTIEQLQTVRGVATEVGLNWLYTRDFTFTRRYLERIRETAASDVAGVCGRYLTEDNLTVTSLRPKYAGKSRRTRQLSRRESEVRNLENGLRLVLIHDDRLPLVHASVVFQGGVLTETAETGGLSRLHSQCLVKGTTRRSALQIAEEIEALGGTLFGDSGFNSFRVSVNSLTEDFASALGLVAEVLLIPSFADDVVERERESQLAAIRAEESQPTVVARNLLRSAIYGAHPYALNLLGTESSVKQLSRQELVGLHNSSVSARDGVIAVCGKFDTAKLVGSLEESFKALPQSLRVKREKLPALEHFETRSIVRRDTRQQAVITIGYLACTLFDPDRVALEILDEATGDSSSRFFVRVREQLGLAYSVGTSLMLGLAPGVFSIYAATSPELVEQVGKLCQEEIQTLANGGLTEYEFDRAKTKLLAHLAFQKQNLDSYAHGMALNELYGLGIDYFEKRQDQIRQVELESVHEVCRKYLMDKPSITVIVRP